MSACPNCGAIARPNDRFCNTCGTPVAQGPAAPPPQGQAGGWAPPSPGADVPRCQVGHEIAPGASYCAMGHPIALAGMQFAAGGAPYGAPAPGAPPYGAPVPGAQPYGAPPPAGPAAVYPGYAAPQNYAPQPGYAPQPDYAPQPPPQPIAPAGYAPAPVAYAPAPGVAPVAHPGYAVPAPAPAPVAPEPAAPAASGHTAAGKILRGFLVSFQMNPSGDFWPIYTGRLLVGRSNAGESLDIPLADATISSRHATFHVDNGTMQVEDTGSTNGTFVNDEHLGFNGRRELKDGDRVRFGGFTTIMKVIARP